MPTRPKTSRRALLDIGIAIATEAGVDAVTVAAVAKAAGIKGPSLYKHFSDRASLLTAIEIDVLTALAARLQQVSGSTPKQRIIGIALAYREHWLSAPFLYSVLYRSNVADPSTLIETYRVAIQPMFDQFEAAGISPPRLLPLARTLVAFMHGFVSMEIAQAFHLGGGLDEAFAAGLETILKDL